MAYDDPSIEEQLVSVMLDLKREIETLNSRVENLCAQILMLQGTIEENS